MHGYLAVQVAAAAAAAVLMLCVQMYTVLAATRLASSAAPFLNHQAYRQTEI